MKCSQKHFILLNSANVALLLNTISDSYAKMGNQDASGQLMKLIYEMENIKPIQ